MPFGIGNPLGGLPDIKTPTIPGAAGASDKIGGIAGLAKSSGKREIEELILRVTVIEEECNAIKKEDELAEVKDEFVRLKRSMYNDLAVAKELLRQRYEIQELRGNTVDAIQKGAKINQKLQTLDADFQKIKEIFKKQTRNKKAVGVEELEKRFKDMQVLKRQIEECRALYKNGAQFSEEEVRTLTDFRGQMREEGVELPKMENRELLEVEKEALGRWAENDKEIDAGLDEVGDVVTRLGELAVNIGDKADQQAKIVATLNDQANTANEDLVQMNDKMKGLLSKGSGMNFCCRLMLAIVLVCEVAFLISRIMNMI